MGGRARVLLLLLLLSCSGCAPQRLNVILISLDSLGTNHMSLYGYGRKTTPNLDAYATHQAVYFRDYYSSAYLTPITEASVHTGRYPVAAGMLNFETSVRGDAPMLAEIMKRSGYRTAAFGTSPEFLIYQAIRGSFQRGFDRYEMSQRRLLPWEPVLQWMRQSSEQPYFLWLALGNMHWPYGVCAEQHFTDPAYHGLMRGVRLSNSTVPHDRGTEANEPVLPGPLLQHIYQGVFYPFGADDDARDFPDLASFPKSPQKLGAADLGHIVDRYDDGVLTGDAWLARFLPQIDDHTIVIICSEHGEDLGDHGRFAHYDLVDTTVHVPLIVRVPGLKRQGAVKGLVSSVDILPTLMELLHLPSIKTNGMSFAPMLQGRPSDRHAVYLTRTPLWERLYDWRPRSAFLKVDERVPAYDTAIRTERWKLVHRRASAVEQWFSWYGHLSGQPVGRIPEFQWFDSQDAEVGEPTVAAELKARLLDWEHEMSQEAAPLHTVPPTLPYF